MTAQSKIYELFLAVELLFKKGCPSDRAMFGAAKHGCLTIVKWLLKKDVELMILIF